MTAEEQAAQNKKDEETKSKSTGGLVIFGFVMLGVGCLVLISVAGFFIWKRMKTKQSAKAGSGSDPSSTKKSRFPSMTLRGSSKKVKQSTATVVPTKTGKTKTKGFFGRASAPVVDPSAQ